MLANIFGLYMGCKVRYEEYPSETLTPEILVEIKDLGFEDFKLILKPLSKITQEHKREFEKVYNHTDIKRIRIEKYYGFVILSDRDFVTFPLPPKEIVWLASRGYDVGIVPDEYKEVE